VKFERTKSIEIMSRIFAIKTLGKRSCFEYYFDQEKLFKLHIRFGKNNNFIEVPTDVIIAVKDRVKSGTDIERVLTSFYNKPKWYKCPDNRTSPYVASLIINNKL
jgi:hypothetical protein